MFLDELPEFNKSTLELLRAPLEDKSVTISRLNSSVNYPCNFMFIASMNPCPCGYYGSSIKCKCSELERIKYLSKISGPLLDRIDIKVEVNPVKYSSLKECKKQESSEKIRKTCKKSKRNSIWKIQKNWNKYKFPVIWKVYRKIL